MKSKMFSYTLKLPIQYTTGQVGHRSGMGTKSPYDSIFKAFSRQHGKKMPEMPDFYLVPDQARISCDQTHMKNANFLTCPFVNSLIVANLSTCQLINPFLLLNILHRPLPLRQISQKALIIYAKRW